MVGNGAQFKGVGQGVHERGVMEGSTSANDDSCTQVCNANDCSYPRLRNQWLPDADGAS